MRRMSHLTVEALARVYQQLDGWIGQRAHDPARPQRRPWVMKPHAAHPADRKEIP
jgi:hypothetical protein